MSCQVCAGASLFCSFGTAPSTLDVLPVDRVTTGAPAASITAMAPFVNIPPFAMCTSLANPEVASATAAAFGVLTPMPCIPVPVAPWSPGAATVMFSSGNALDNTSTLECSWGGVISILAPGQFSVMVS